MFRFFDDRRKSNLSLPSIDRLVSIKTPNGTGGDIDKYILPVSCYDAVGGTGFWLNGKGRLNSSLMRKPKRNLATSPGCLSGTCGVKSYIVTKRNQDAPVALAKWGLIPVPPQKTSTEPRNNHYEHHL